LASFRANQKTGSLLMEKSTDALTGFRGGAILIVLLSHFNGRGIGIVDILNFHGAGRAGIYMFFVLSAFLCHSSLERHGIKDYFIKRFFRVAPSFYFVVSVVLIYGIWYELNSRYLHVNSIPILHYLFIRGDGVFWTIPTEIFYYFLIPVIAVHIKPIYLPLLAFVFFTWFVFFEMSFLPPPLLVINNHGTQFTEVFLMGSFIFYFRDLKVWDKLYERRWLVFLSLLVGAFGIISLLFKVPITGGGNGLSPLSRNLTLPWAILMSFYVLGIYRGNRILLIVFGRRFLVLLGSYAYTLYLTHMAALQITNAIFDMALLRLICGILVTALMAYLLTRYIELPGIRLGNRLTQAKIRRSQDSSATVGKV